jgi:hypothetical protein
MTEQEREKEQSAKERILGQIAKLMRMTTDRGCTVDEAATAASQCRKLMQKYGIAEDEAMFRQADQQQCRVQAVEDYVELSGKTVRSWRKSLPYVVDLICDTKSFIRSWKTGKTEIHFVGLQRDVEVAKSLYTALHATIRAMSLQHYRRNQAAETASYCEGFVAELVCRAKEMRKTEDNKCTAIVVRKADVINDWFTSNIPGGLGKAIVRRKNVVGDAYYKGAADAREVGLHANGIEGEKKMRPDMTL